MNPVLNIIGGLLGGNNPLGAVGNAQVNGVSGGNVGNVGNVGNTESRLNINEIFGLINMLRGTSDPMATLKSMSQNNSYIKQAFDYVDQNGGDIQSAFYKLAEQRGVDPNQIMSLLRR